MNEQAKEGLAVIMILFVIVLVTVAIFHLSMTWMTYNHEDTLSRIKAGGEYNQVTAVGEKIQTLDN